MNKRLLIAGASLAIGMMVGAAIPALAADGAAGGGGAAASSRNPDELRVYYSESLGAGQKVYRLSSCEKGESYSPITCNAVNADTYEGQCKGKGANDQPQILYGTIVKGCDAADLPRMDNRSYAPKKVDPLLFNDPTKGCAKLPNNQIFAYGYRFAILELPENASDADAEDPKKITTSITWEEKDSPPTQDDILKILYEDKDELAAKKADLAQTNTKLIAKIMYQTAECVTGDVVIDPNGDLGPPLASNELAQSKFESAYTSLKDLIALGCNNDNTTSPLKVEDDQGAYEIPRATVLNSMSSYTCTTAERITGKSGTDLLARYAGAIYRWTAGIGGIISVFIIVISGIQMIVGGGDQGAVDKAKERITQSLFGLVLLFLSSLILYLINPTFFTP